MVKHVSFGKKRLLLIQFWRLNKLKNIHMLCHKTSLRQEAIVFNLETYCSTNEFAFSILFCFYFFFIFLFYLSRALLVLIYQTSSQFLHIYIIHATTNYYSRISYLLKILVKNFLLILLCLDIIKIVLKVPIEIVSRKARFFTLCPQ